jgi:hypothetical protein
MSYLNKISEHYSNSVIKIFVKEIDFNSCEIVSEESVENKSKKVNNMNNNVFKFVWPKYKYKTYFGKNLKRHDLIHTEEKRFKYYFENFNKEFKRKYCLKLHKKKIGSDSIYTTAKIIFFMYFECNIFKVLSKINFNNDKSQDLVQSQSQ